MILVRDIFQLKFGAMKPALDLWKEGQSFMRTNGNPPVRMLTDLSGEYYTLVMESTFPNLTDFERERSSTTMPDGWRDWYQQFSNLVQSGRREIFTIVQ
ncbi:hypothetical protein C3F09_04820 [candidate division GN15 bacterium]|uniref:NIPSNAP domain-containing protein n=1 Tax=candidate division GN15 bacterium TaxID=2072418 RepID=A0A855X4L6_9BACT|nr:MAG: hypothetical protein C3F09_04820 [candidate division GN15 bacterium]